MGTWKLKGCPRCNGDVSTSDGEYGKYENCLQCGYIGYPKSTVTLERQNPVIFKEPVAIEH